MRFRQGYTGLRVRDLDAAVEFYVGGLGMLEEDRAEIPETGGVVVDLRSEGSEQRLELNWYPEGSEFATPYEPGEALDHLMFRVEGGSLDEAIRHLEAHGGRLSIPPFEEGRSVLAYVEGPDGHTVELVVPREDTSPA